MKLGIMAAAIAAGVSLSVQGGESPARSFHLYYGNSPKEVAKLAEGFKPGAIAVIDTRVLKTDVLKGLRADAKASGTRLLGYLSIGEVHADEVEELKRFLAEAGSESRIRRRSLESITIDRNETFNSYRINVAEGYYFRAWIRKKAAAILELGMDGLFLDTVDTVDTYITHEAWSLERREGSVVSMIALIRNLKKEHPDAYLLQNGGLNIIGESVFIGNAEGILTTGMDLAISHPRNPDGVLWENAFANSDAWSKGRLEELRRIRSVGSVDVFALGYEKSFPDSEVFFAKCRDQRFIGAWAESSEVLHEAATVSAPDNEED